MPVRLLGKEKILIHLLSMEEKYQEGRSSFSKSPFALCQEGVADIVEFSRNRAGDILRELEEEKIVESEYQKVSGGFQKRYIYNLTDKGKEKAEEIKKQVEEEKISLRKNEETHKIKLKDVDEHIKGIGNLLFVIKNLDQNNEINLDNIGKKHAFVDREEEMDLLKERIDGLLEEGYEDEGMILFKGPLGAGKSRLIEESEKYVCDLDIDFFDWKCNGGSIVVDEGSKKIFTDLISSEVEEGYRVLEEDIQREDLSGRLKSRAEKNPLILSFDDLHRATGPLIELYQYLSEELKKHPVQFLGTYREDDLKGDVKDSIKKLESLDVSRVLEVKTLGWKGIREMIVERIGRRNIPDSFVNSLQNITDGLPLFIEAYLDELLERGTLDPVEGRYPDLNKEMVIPERIKRFYIERLEDFDEIEKDVVYLSSFFEREVLTDILSELIDGKKEEIGSAVEKVKSSNLIETPISGMITFPTELIRLSLYRDLDEDYRRKKHAEIAELFVDYYDRDEEEYFSRLARHHARSENHEEALKHYIKAGERAEKEYEIENAIVMYKRAMRIQKSVPEKRHYRRKLFEKLGEIEIKRGSLKKGEKYLKKAKDLSEDLFDEQRLERKLSSSLRRRGDFDKALESVQRSLETIDQIEGEKELLEEERCRCLKEKAITYMRKNEFDRAEEILKDLEDRSMNLNIPRVEAEVYHYLGSIGYYRSDYDTAEIYLQRAIEISEMVDDIEMIAKSRNNLGVIYRHDQRYDTALEEFKEADRLTRKSGLKKGDPDALSNMGIIYNDMGELDKALEYHEKCLDIEKSMEDKKGMASTFQNIGVIEYDKGKLDRALKLFKATLKLKTKQGEKHGVGLVHYNLGKVYREKGDLNKALDHFRKSLDIRKKKDFTQGIAETSVEKGTVHMEIGELDRAESLFNEALDIFRKIDNEYGMGITLSYLGKLHKLKKDIEKSRLYIDHSKTIGKNFMDKKFEIINHRLMAEIYMADGKVQEAHELIKESLKHAREMGAEIENGKSTHLRGNIYYDQDHWYQASEGYRKAFEIFDEMGNKKEKAKVLFDWSRMLKRIGEKEEAMQKLEEAVELFKECGHEEWCSLERDTPFADILLEIGKY